MLVSDKAAKRESLYFCILLKHDKMERREFLKKSAMAVAAIAATGLLATPVISVLDKQIDKENDNESKKEMKKIVIINGSPRKHMNTAALTEAFAQGVASANKEIDVKEYWLYDYQYSGCKECYACKLKNSKFTDVCAVSDEILPVLREAAYADGLVLASPMFFGNVTAMTQAFFERLAFPWSSYDNKPYSAPVKPRPTATIYTMNSTSDNVFSSIQTLEWLLSVFTEEKPQRVVACNTLPQKDYGPYALAGLPENEKRRWHDQHWEQDLRNAFNAGKSMAEKLA